jgi:hypothetical protein
MSESTPEPAPPPAASVPEVQPEPQMIPQERVNALLAEQKRKERERFSDYDDLKAKAERLAQMEEASKTEQQRTAEAAQKAQQEAAEARAEALRYKAAATHKIDPDYFDLLGSGDEETIGTRAERVGSLLAAQREVEQLRAENEALRAGRPAPTTARPVESLRPGATPENALTEDDVLYNSLFAPQN